MSKIYTLDDLRVGSKESFTVGVTEDDVARFADLSGDRAPLHTDAEFARSQGMPGSVAHGMFLGALVSRLIGMQLPGRYGILQSMELGFRRPVTPPVRLTVAGEVTRISTGTGQVVIAVAITDEAGGLVCTAQVKSLLRIMRGKEHPRD
ncbi:MAG: MaoC/PaaZ C-terminal domain-containing protein [bacterium]